MTGEQRYFFNRGEGYIVPDPVYFKHFTAAYLKITFLGFAYFGS